MVGSPEEIKKQLGVLRRRDKNIAAAIRIVNSIAVVRELSANTANSTRGVKLPRANANANAPEAPIPAPSVAVNQPP